MPRDVPPWAYFDTSVLLKRYVREHASARARALLRRHRFLSSAILPVEAISALSRRRSAGDLTDEHFQAIMARVRQDRDYWELVEPTSHVLSQAEWLITSTGLRTMDAIHLASALTVQTLSGLLIPFVTADEQQCEAAQRMGLSVLWVGT